MIYKVPVIKWWALCPAANDADAFDIPMRAIAQNGCTRDWVSTYSSKPIASYGALCECN